MIRSSLITLLILFSGTAFAQDLSYTYLQGSYEVVDVDPLDIDGEGIGLDASLALTDQLYVVGSYQGTGLDFDVDLSRWTAGLGLHGGMTDTLDFFAEASYLYIEAEGPVDSVDDNGLMGRVGMRTNFGGPLEFQGAARYDDISEEFGYDAGVLLNFTENFSLGVFGLWEDDVTTYRAGVRLSF